jgi:peptidoglycan hydrolase-like protein with peptidoglycan-binding domain
MRMSPLIVAALLGAWIAPAAAQPPSIQTPYTLTYTQPLAPPAVKLVQQQLRQEGAYTGRIDGIWGADSQAALARFQQTHGLQVTGQLNQATVASLGIPPEELLSAGAPPASAASATLVAGDALSRASVQAIQSRLRDLNFYNGPTDGIWGAATQQAIERFQQGRGLHVNGQLNPAAIAALGLDPNILQPSR